MDGRDQVDPLYSEILYLAFRESTQGIGGALRAVGSPGFFDN
jgi:hypothetical protein